MDTRSIISRLAEQNFIASMDISGAFHSMLLSDSAQEVTGFSAGLDKYPGRFCYTRTPMGLKNSSSILNAAMTKATQSCAADI